MYISTDIYMNFIYSVIFARGVNFRVVCIPTTTVNCNTCICVYIANCNIYVFLIQLSN